MSFDNQRLMAIARYGNAAVMVFFALYFFLLPGCIVIYRLNDPGLHSPGVPRLALSLERDLTPKFQKWARGRVHSGAALAAESVSSTEWPLFGSVFYLWSLEALQDAWEKDPALAPHPPAESAREAIDAAAALVADPSHAAWVKAKWGADYLHTENVFYRMLLMGGLTSHRRLTGSNQYLELLRDQVETLAAALDASPHGQLNDYPGECYPTDVLAAVVCIRRADRVLGTDHSGFVERMRRGFEGRLLDELGLPPYDADAETGLIGAPARGCGNSYATLFAPEIWPDKARQWYAAHEAYYWQERWTGVGFREFSKKQGGDWYMDVDAGPVLAGHGIAASAFGLGAARVNGRFDQAWPLACEMLVTSWPLPSGTLAGARLLSNAVDAPYLGEAAILYMLTRSPAAEFTVVSGGRIPAFVYIVLAGYFGMALLLLWATRRHLRRSLALTDPPRAARLQFVCWALLLLLGCVFGWLGALKGLLCLLLAQLLPRGPRARATTQLVKMAGE